MVSPARNVMGGRPGTARPTPSTSSLANRTVGIETDKLAPRVDWATFLRYFDWRQGEHVALIGPTGTGKTTLALELVKLRTYVVAFATKPRDTTLTTLINTGQFKLLKRWKNYDPTLVPRRVLWPRADKLYSAREQNLEFRLALDDIYPQGGWCIFVDELWFVCQHLKLSHEIKTYLLQSRALDISLLLATQRPAFVPVEVYDQSTHLFFWRDGDEANLRRLAGISWANAWHVQRLIANLNRHETLYVNTQREQLFRFTAPSPDTAAAAAAVAAAGKGK